MHDSSPGESTDVTSRPGWIRYTLVAGLCAVVGIGLVVALYDKGVLPIAGPFVVLFLLPILVPLRNRGLRNRTRRLGDRPDEGRAALGPALDRERSPAPHGRASGASDEALTSAATADGEVASTTGNLRSLRARLADERAREAGSRPSQGADDELDRAIERVARADAALAAGQVRVASRELAELAYMVGDSWPHSDLGAEILSASQALERRSGRS